MKSPILILIVICGFVLPVRSQTITSQYREPITPGGYFDKVFDKDGREYFLENLAIREIGQGDNGINSVISATCQSGIFVAHFANGSGMASPTNTFEIACRNTVCQVLENVSGLLGWTGTWPAGGYVHILVDDVSNYVANTSTSGVLGLASSYYAYPTNPFSPNPGIIKNQMEKTIQSKTNAWTNVVSPLNAGGFNYYHGFMAFNFANTSFTWNPLHTTTATANQYDLYTVILHEVTHALGFASLINGNGLSKFGALNNYYSSYDNYLYTGGGTKLLTSNGCSWQYGLSFNTNTLVLQPACPCPTCYTSDITNCNVACEYSSSLVPSMPIYNPNCFEPPSSLSHFEDMCYPTNTPSNNNMYFTMSNASATGSNKRFLKQEERNVLCDLGYTVITSYTSSALSATTAYTGGTCTSNDIWGINDGISGAAYTYTTATNVLTVAITGGGGILANDASSASSATCVETVYNNGSVSVSGNIISFTAATGYAGFILLRYIPLDASGNQGNITYIFGYIFPAQCNPVSPCDMVQNGNFEQNNNCGALGNSVSISCWSRHSLSADLLVESCTFTGSGTPCNLGSSTMNSSPTFSSHNQTNNPNNNSVVGLGGFAQIPSGNHQSESITNYLGTPLINGQVYQLSFWAYQYTGTKTDPLVPAAPFAQNQFSLPLVMSFGTSTAPIVPQATFPSTVIIPLITTTLNNVMNTWHFYNNYQFTYTATGSNNGIFLHAGLNSLLNQSLYNGSGNPLPGDSYYRYYLLLDEVSIKTVSQTPTFTLPLANTCASNGYLDLAQYVNFPGGVFTGSGVTTTTVGSNIQYNFNSPATLPNGLYTITYTFTDNIGCQQVTYYQVNVTNIAPGPTIAVSFSPNALCSNSGTLSIVSPSAGLSYTWQPGGVNSTITTVTVTSITTYSALATLTNGCLVMGTITVPANIPSISVSQTQFCENGTATLAIAGTYSNVIWEPGSVTANTYTISGSPMVYTVTATNTLGCTNTTTFLPTVSTLPSLTITASPSTVCPGQTTTLTSTGNFISVFYLAPLGYSNNPIVITPTTTSTYSIIAFAANGCPNTGTVSVTVNPGPGVLLTSSYMSVCPNYSNTLTATLFGANTVTWLPSNTTVNPIVVTPTTNTTYTAITTNSYGCSSQNTITVSMNTLSVSLSSNSLCPFQTASITAIGNFSSVVWQPGSVSGSVLTVPTGTPNTYTATATYSSGCTLTQTITPPPLDASPFDFYFITTPTAGICAGSQATVDFVNASFGVTVQAWNPGGYTTSPIVITPTAPIQFTIQVLTAPNCIYDVIETLNVKTDCCTSGTVSPISSITQSVTNLTGTNIINFPLSIASSKTLNVTGELLIASGVSITVNGLLKLDGAHLYSCGTDMWEGITLMPGSTFSSEAASYSNLIEDAKTAVTVFAPPGNGFGQWSNPNSFQPATCHISNTIFNKNNVGIHIAEFPLTTSTNYNFKINSSVFTCRNYTFTSTTWAQAGVSSPGLRFATTQASTVLSSPYLMNGVSVATKKAPYNTANSHTGIRIDKVGTTTTVSIHALTIGDPANTLNNYNIFDAHMFGIDGSNCHLNSYNNVFQNNPQSVFTKGMLGNSGIRHINTYYSANRNIVWFTNAKLDLVSPGNAVACNNRFYNCNTGVLIAGTATVNIRHALFSSSQSTTNPSAPGTNGFLGISVQSNKFHDYQIHTNKFLNLSTGIKAEVKFDYVSLTPPTTTYGESWGTFSCTANYFSAASATGAAVGSGYMAKGIYIGVPVNSQTGTPISFYSAGTVNGIRIAYNNFDRVRTGVEMLGLECKVYQKTLTYNAIVLAAETNTNNAQYGIKSAGNIKSVVNTNTVVGFGKNLTLNVAGILHQGNLPGSDVRCNRVSFVTRGFEFKDQNPSSVWRYNTLIDCDRGMQASNWGTTSILTGIGQQGSSSQKSGNSWLSFSTGVQTYVDGNTDVQNAKLWVNNTGSEDLVQSLQSYSPGVPQGKTYWNPNNRPTTSSGSNPCPNPIGGGCTYCSGGGEEEEYDVDSEIYNLLLFISTNLDSLIAQNNDTLIQWYEDLEEEVGTLFEIEDELAEGDFETAQDLINGFSPETNVQTNYRDYFQIYHNFAIDDTMSTGDSTDLFILASQCPGRDGPAVHKARALYNLIYNTILAFNDDTCETIGYSERQMEHGQVRPNSELSQLLTHESDQIKGKFKIKRNLLIYPNPAQEILYIRGGKKDERVNVRIYDTWGRTLTEENYTLGNDTSIKLNLINGIYFVYITNTNGDQTIRKLIISK
ncbi:MAG: T9SS type A sorting domain-containing protein [Bacteroidia bacterium]|jgi:hypothetical protein|nr:T9SS type A sorting domain-containing protein [Bacteroidia bacterium]